MTIESINSRLATFTDHRPVRHVIGRLDSAVKCVALAVITTAQLTKMCLKAIPSALTCGKLFRSLSLEGLKKDGVFLGLAAYKTIEAFRDVFTAPKEDYESSPTTVARWMQILFGAYHTNSCRLSAIQEEASFYYGKHSLGDIFHAHTTEMDLRGLEDLL